MNESPQNEKPLLTDADIQEFIQIYKEEFEESLSPKEAREMASRLLELYSVLYLPPLGQPTGEPSKLDEPMPLPPARKMIDIVPPKEPKR